MRKNILVLALLFCGGFYLAAQSSPDASIYVTPVTGKGSKPEDNFLFYTRLVNELTIQKAKLASASRDAEYSLFGTLAPHIIFEGQYIFHLELRDNRTGGIAVEGELLYEAPDDTNQLFPVLVTNLLYTIPPGTIQPEPTPPDPVPVEPEKTDDWRNKWLYLSLAAKWTPGLYSRVSGVERAAFPGIQGGISAEVQFINFMAVETGIEVGVDGVRAKISGKETDFHNFMLEIPLLVKFIVKPGANSMLEPYLGAYFNIPLVKNFDSYPVSLIGGFQYGIKVGPGAIFLNAGFSVDLGNCKVSTIPYHRYNIHLGAGYKYGLFQR